MRIRWHKSYGHGLRPGTDQDICCMHCALEKAAGIKPDITGTDAR